MEPMVVAPIGRGEKIAVRGEIDQNKTGSTGYAEPVLFDLNSFVAPF
jgi:hypothetical protein